MSPCRGDLQRAFGDFLSLDVAQIRIAAFFRLHARFGAQQNLRSLEMIDKREKRGRGKNFQIACPDSLAAIFGGADDAAPCGACGDGGGQDSGDGRQSAIQCQLTQRGIAGYFFLGQNPHRRQNAQSDRQIEMRPFFQHIGRRQINGDMFGGQSQPKGEQSGADAFTAFGNGFVGQTN